MTLREKDGKVYTIFDSIFDQYNDKKITKRFMKKACKTLWTQLKVKK